MNDQSPEPLPEFAQEWLSAYAQQNDQHLLSQACHVCLNVTLLKQGISIAQELQHLQCDTQTLAAAICYPSFKLGNFDKAWLDEQLGGDVTKLLVGTQRMDAIDTLQTARTEFSAQRHQTDTLRKMLLAVVDDIRIVLIKLAERINALTLLRDQPTDVQHQIAKQVMDLYAPLANRLGVGHLKWQLEDWAFRYINPQAYFEISKALNMRRKDRENHIHNIVQELKLLLDHAGIKHAKITGRAKHIYSIYRKIQHKHVNFEKIYDASAVRILVPTLEDCYTTLSVVHNTWTHIPEEFDDYIAKPKANGYQSIHTAVSNDHDLVFEIQIRTFAMHESSELGIASHWKYKEKDSATPEKQYEQKINWLRELMDWQRELTQEDPQHKDLYSKIFKDQIYVFTPDNDVLDLAAGATPLDFAYHVHTQVGHRCKGAKVNGHIVPLSHALQTGDRVEIITGKEPHPSRDWLSQNSGYLKTHHARVKVRHWFRQLNHEQHVAHGEELWEKAHRRYHFSKDALKKAAKLFGFETNERFLSEVGSGHLGIQTVVHRLLGSPEPSSAHEPVVPTTTQAPPHHISEMNIEGVDGLLMQLARCCQPIPGDEIIGYITKGRGITIHHKNCRNIQQALQYRSQRTIHVNWSGASLKKFSVDLFIEAEDRPGLIRDISNIIANEHIPILRLNTQVNTLENRCFIQTSLQVSSLTTLADIIRKIELTPSIQSVMRKTI